MGLPLFSALLDAKASKSVGKKDFDAAVSVGTACLLSKKVTRKKWIGQNKFDLLSIIHVTVVR